MWLMNEKKFNGIILAKCKCLIYLLIKNDVLKIFVCYRDWPVQMEIGEKWKIIGKKSTNNKYDYTWVVGDKYGKSSNSLSKTLEQTVFIFWRFKSSLNNSRWVNKFLISIWKMLIIKNYWMNWWELKLLVQITILHGQKLNFNFCNLCQRKIDLNYWNLDYGGAVCSLCAESNFAYRFNEGERIMIWGDWNYSLTNNEKIIDWIILLQKFLQVRGGLCIN